MSNEIDRSKDLLFVVYNHHNEHAWIYSSKDAYYDKGDRHEREIAKHLSKPNTQLVILSGGNDPDDYVDGSGEGGVLERDVPEIILGKDPSEFNYESKVFNSINEWADQDEWDEDDEEWDEDD